MSNLPIADYALLSDCRSSAFFRDGSIFFMHGGALLKTRFHGGVVSI